MKALNKHLINARASLMWNNICDRARAFHLSRTGQATQLAWHNLSTHGLRSVASAGGLSVALLLMFVQLGFLDATQRKVTAFYDLFDFDIAVISRAYQFFYDAPAFDFVRLVQARAHPSIEATLPLSTDTGDWEDIEEERQSSLLMFGVTPDDRFFASKALKEGMDLVVQDSDVLIDGYSHADFGNISTGTQAEVNGKRVTIRGEFNLGLFFYADGAILTNRQNFLRLANVDSRTANIGLLKLTPGARPALTARELSEFLPPDVKVLTRNKMLEQERDYFVSIKPLGIILRTGALFAFVVGAVIIYQVLATDILNRMRELAVMKAMGFSMYFVYGVSIAQAVIIFMGGFLPSVIAAFLLFRLTNSALHLGLELNSNLLLTVGLMSFAMVLAACVLTLHRIRHADPAELY